MLTLKEASPQQPSSEDSFLRDLSLDKSLFNPEIDNQPNSKKSVMFTSIHSTRFIDESMEQTTSTPTDKKEQLKAVFKAELKEAIDEAKLQLTAYLHNAAQDIRWMVLDTNMKLSNATTMIEEKFDAILKVLSIPPNDQENCLLRENQKLLEMIEQQNIQLEEKEKQLGILKKQLDELGFGKQ